MPRTLRCSLACALLLLPACGDDDGAQPGPDAALPLDPVTFTGPTGRLERPYALDLSTVDPRPEERTWSLLSGALPPGLTLGADGTVDGTPVDAGRFEAVIAGQGACGAASCRLTVYLTVPVAEIVLLSGYGPFSGIEDNPSWLAVEPLDGSLIGGYDVRTVELPVEWEDAPLLYFAEYERLRPAIALAAGVAMGEDAIRLEQVAHNLADGEDEAGVLRDATPIDAEGPSTRESTLPLVDLRNALQAAGFPAQITDDAGTYLCNYIFYLLLGRTGEEADVDRVLGGFFHVPGNEVIAPDDMTAAFVVAIATIASYRDALRQKRRVPGDRTIAGVIHHAPRYGRTFRAGE